MSDVISVENISVAYKLYAKPLDVVHEMFFGGVRHETFWALKDVSLSVKEGERVGIVGPNGAGKTTLLKAIAGNITPVSGKITVAGRVSSLLSMVPAWNGESSGIENIRFNLLLQGAPERQIASLTEDIVDFTELGPFIYQPVKTYSTGMAARLSFAIATASNPDILIIDEVLGTGDGYFAAKAYQRMREFCARGRALLFVSHAIAAVQQMCDRAIWIQDGSVRMDGPAIPVLSKYEFDYRQREDDAVRLKHVGASTSIASGPTATEVSSEALRLRIIPLSGFRFFTTHYVRAIRVTNLISNESGDIPLNLPETSAIRMGALDVMSSEWGRLHERHGCECRVLQRVAARNSGGQIILGRDLAHTEDGKLKFRVEFECASRGRAEELGIQVLDLKQGEWRFFEKTGSDGMPGGWQKVTYEGAIELPASDVAEQIRERLIEEGRAKVEIMNVDLVAAGASVRVVKEQEPFELVARVMFRKRVPIADVGFKFTRADGAHVFWQSSGLTGANLADVEGEREVRFHFDENIFGAGEYFVSVYVADGWRYPDNFPHAEIFQRRINALAFKILPAMPPINFGIVAKLFNVTVT